MKNKIGAFVLCLIIPVLVGSSCHQTKNGTTIPSVHFDNVIHLKGEVWPLEIVTMPPSQVEIIDSMLFLFRPGGVVAKMINLKDRSEEGVFGFMGRGPEDFLSPTYAGQNKKDSIFFVYDIGTKALKYFKWKKENDEFKIDYLTDKRYSGNVGLFSCTVMENGYMVSRTISPGEGVLVLTDILFDVQKRFCHPLEIEMEDFRSYVGHAVSSGNRFVYAMMDLGYIGCFEVLSNGEVSKEWEYLLSKPMYETSPEFSLLREKNKEGFYDVKMTDKYVYGLYSGKILQMDNYDHLMCSILIFDLEGNPLHELVLDGHESIRFAVSSDNRTVYLYSLYDDGSIVEYDISSLRL